MRQPSLRSPWPVVAAGTLVAVIVGGCLALILLRPPESTPSPLTAGQPLRQTALQLSDQIASAQAQVDAWYAGARPVYLRAEAGLVGGYADQPYARLEEHFVADDWAGWVIVYHWSARAGEPADVSITMRGASDNTTLRPLVIEQALPMATLLDHVAALPQAQAPLEGIAFQLTSDGSAQRWHLELFGASHYAEVTLDASSGAIVTPASR